MQLWNLFAAASLISATAISAIEIHCNQRKFRCGTTRFHVTDLHISANPNDDLPEVSFHVSGYRHEQPYRSFGPTECKVGLDWGNQHHSLTGIIPRRHCHNPSVTWAFGKSYEINYATGDVLFAGWFLQMEHHYRLNGKPEGRKHVDRVIVEFGRDQVKTSEEGCDEYDYIDHRSDFKHQAFTI